MSRARPFPRTPTAPWVLAFAREMEAKLDLNREKGNREGWSKRHALAGKEPPIRQRDVRGECADIANFAMMIADVAGKMQPEGGGNAQ